MRGKLIDEQLEQRAENRQCSIWTGLAVFCLLCEEPSFALFFGGALGGAIVAHLIREWIKDASPSIEIGDRP